MCNDPYAVIFIVLTAVLMYIFKGNKTSITNNIPA